MVVISAADGPDASYLALRERLISRFSIDTTEEGYALGYEFDIVLRGANQTPTEA